MKRYDVPRASRVSSRSKADCCNQVNAARNSAVTAMPRSNGRSQLSSRPISTWSTKIRVKVDAKIDNPDRVGRVAAQISQIAKHLEAFAQKRRELEGPMGPQAALQKDDSLLDTTLLEEFGLVDIANPAQAQADATQAKGLELALTPLGPRLAWTTTF